MAALCDGGPLLCRTFAMAALCDGGPQSSPLWSVEYRLGIYKFRNFLSNTPRSGHRGPTTKSVTYVCSSVKNSPLEICASGHSGREADANIGVPYVFSPWKTTPLVKFMLAATTTAVPYVSCPVKKTPPLWHLWLRRGLTHDVHKHVTTVGNLRLLFCVRSWRAIQGPKYLEIATAHFQISFPFHPSSFPSPSPSFPSTFPSPSPFSYPYLPSP